jgi:protein disulfide-isomerase A1
MAEDYKKVATQLKDQATIAEVDCTVEADLCERFGVRGYPTLKMFHKGEFASDYKGQRTLDALTSYIQRAVQPATTPLTSSDALLEFLKNNEDKTVVIALSGPGNVEQSAFEGAAREVSELNPDAVFATVDSEELFKAAADNQDIESKVVIRRAGAVVPVAAGASLAQSILIETVPAVGVFGSENAMLYNKVCERWAGFVRHVLTSNGRSACRCC